MRNVRFLTLAVAAVVLAVPCYLLAQTYGTDPASTSASSEQHVIGTVVSITSDRLELRAEPASGVQETGAGGGEVLSFTLASGIDKPMDLKSGDRAEVWYSMQNGERVVSKITLASGEAASATSSATSSSESSSASSESSATSSSEQAAGSEEQLPQTASNLPLIGLIGLLALGAALALRGFVRA